jgi:hypothetical protein
MSLILVYFILLNGRTTEREGEDMREGNNTSFSSELFMELASESRLSILMTLKDRPCSLGLLEGHRSFLL